MRRLYIITLTNGCMNKSTISLFYVYLLGFRDCSNDDEIIIMDFFSGSDTTTAEAVMEMSKDIIDKLLYILIQL